MNHNSDSQATKEKRKRNYQNLMISPMRPDAFDENTDEIPFADVMKAARFQRDKKEMITQVSQSKTENYEPPKKIRRWDCPTPAKIMTPVTTMQWDETPGRISSVNVWDKTPKTSETPIGNLDKSVRNDMMPSSATPGTIRPSRWDATPGTIRPSRWDATPRRGEAGETPSNIGTPGMTPNVAYTPGGSTPFGSQASMMNTPKRMEQSKANQFKNELNGQDIYYTNEELDEIFPEGYRIINPPKGYNGQGSKSKKITGSPSPYINNGFVMSSPSSNNMSHEGMNEMALGVTELDDGTLLKPEDLTHFELLLNGKDERSMTGKELKKKEVLTLLLKYKNGKASERRSTRRELTKRAAEFGPLLLFDILLPILLNPNLEDQERHLLVKLINNFLYKLEDKVRPFTHKILVVVIPMLIDEQPITRQVGREVISNLAKAVGLSTMITVLRPDIDNQDEGVRKVCATALAVVGHCLGVNNILSFLKAVCSSKKSWQARHTGIRIINQLAIILKCSILPYLDTFIQMIEKGLEDVQQQVRTITALTIASLAESAAPYGINEFDSVLKSLWKGVHEYRGKTLAAYLKAIGFVVVLMESEPEYARYYIEATMLSLIREFSTPDEVMKVVVLQVLIQCCRSNHIDANYIVEKILPPFFKHFWHARNANNHKLHGLMANIVVEMAGKVDVMPVLTNVIDSLRDESELFRRLSVESIDKIIQCHGHSLIDPRTEAVLMDRLMCVFNEQSEDPRNTMINSYGSIMMSLGLRCQPYTSDICAHALFRMNNRSAKVRQQSAEILAKIAPVMTLCGNEYQLRCLCKIVFENLGEEYPDVLGSILKALNSIVRSVGVMNSEPHINEILQRLTPILKNRHEKVQENGLDLIGYIAENAGDQINSREWMRILFDLIAIFSSPRKSIRRAAIQSFGYISSAVGPMDVLKVLLTNLKVQDRQQRVCSTIAIAVVADTCRPFYALAAVMNEYRTPDLNVQHGVLKSLSFMFEYIGEMSKDYIYAITPLLTEATCERDIVHRQTAISAIGHLVLGVNGYGCEDALIHLLNAVWPNFLETSPHMEKVFIRCLECFGVSLGTNAVLPYLTQGLYHPAKAVRNASWKVYNAIYLLNQDGLVCSYPRIDDENGETYTRYNLQYRL